MTEKFAINDKGQRKLYKLSEDGTKWEAMPGVWDQNYNKERYAIDADSNRILYRLVTNNATGESRWYKVPTDFTIDNHRSDIDRLAQDPSNLISDSRDEFAKVKGELAKNTHPVSKTFIEAGKVTTGMLTGAGSLATRAAGFAADNWGRNHPELVDPSLGARLYNFADRIDARRADERELMKEFEQEKGIAGAIGGMLPYSVTSALGAPFAKKISGKFLDTVEATADVAKTGAKGLLTRSVDAAANSKLPGLEQFGKRAQQEWLDPLAKAKKISRKQGNLKSPYYKDSLSDVLGSGLLGAAEGGINADSTMLDGAIAGLVGGTTGRSLKYVLEPAPLPNKPAYNELMSRRNEWGRRNTPGEVLDIPELQTFEHGLRSNPRTSLLMKTFDEANQKADNRHAFSAMGYKDDTITKEQLNAFTKNLSDEYQALSNRTSARIDRNDISALKKHALSLTKQSTDEGVQAAKAAADWLKKLETFRKQAKSVRRPSGQFDTQVAGKTWQELRSELKEDIKAAYDGQKPNLARALRPFLDTINGSAEQGIVRLGSTVEEGQAMLAHWRDLDERFAMSKILKEHGLDDVTLNVSPTKLYNYFRSDDPERLVTGNYGKTGRISKLYDVAEGRPLDMEQAGSTLSSTRTRDANSGRNESLLQKLVQSPKNQFPGRLDSMALGLYLSPRFSPAVRGYSFGLLDGKGPRSSVNLFRSAAQSTQLAPTILHGIYDVGTYVGDAYDTTKKRISTVWDAIENISKNKQK